MPDNTALAPSEIQLLLIENQSLRADFAKVDASKDAALKRAEELHALALAAFKECAQDRLSRIRTANLVTPGKDTMPSSRIRL